MAICAHCCTPIFLGGKTEGELRFCSERCRKVYPIGVRVGEALSEGRWDDLDPLCAEWSGVHPRELTLKTIQALAWMLGSRPRPLAAISQFDDVIQRKSELGRAEQWCKARGNDSPAWQLVSAVIESIAADYDGPLRGLTSTSDKSPDPLIVLALLVPSGKATLLERAVALHPLKPFALFFLAGEYRAIGRPRETLSLLTQFTQTCPDCVDGHFALAKQAQEHGQGSVAAEHFGKVLALAPTSELARQARSELETHFVTASQSTTVGTTGAVAVNLDAVPERVNPPARGIPRMPQWKIVLWSIGSVFVIGGPIASTLGSRDALIGVAVGVIVYTALSAWSRRES